MTNYCRLCAELKDPFEIVTSIIDAEQLMDQKLRACCQWTTENTEQQLPHSVCASCLDKLDKCWLFAQSVQLAQQKLQEIFDDHITEIKIENEIDTEIEMKPLDIVVEQVEYNYPANSNDSVANTPQSKSPQISSKPSSLQKEKKKTSLTEKSESKSNECPICGKCFKKWRTWNLKQHIQRHSENRPFECWLCHKTFQLQYRLKEHFVIHVLSPKARREKQLARKQAMQMKKILGKAVQKCEKCNKFFTLKSSLEAHLKTKHSNIYPFECCLCHKIFKTRQLLKSHIIVHIRRRKGKTLKQNCICEQCGKSFKQRTHLNDHRSAHSDQRPFKCNICGMGYKLKRSLKSHQISHMEYQYKCTQCEKAFRKKSSLTKHLEYHTGSVAKPFVCDFCGKGFRFNANYAEHRRIHTGETPYACEYCSLKFRTMSSFYTHLKKSHGIAKSVLNKEQRAKVTAMSVTKVHQPPQIPK